MRLASRSSLRTRSRLQRLLPPREPFQLEVKPAAPAPSLLLVHLSRRRIDCKVVSHHGLDRVRRLVRHAVVLAPIRVPPRVGGVLTARFHGAVEHRLARPADAPARAWSSCGLPAGLRGRSRRQQSDGRRAVEPAVRRALSRRLLSRLGWRDGVHQVRRRLPVSGGQCPTGPCRLRRGHVPPAQSLFCEHRRLRPVSRRQLVRWRAKHAHAVRARHV